VPSSVQADNEKAAAPNAAAVPVILSALRRESGVVVMGVSTSPSCQVVG